jgi:SAM-dependent methyltransferase
MTQNVYDNPEFFTAYGQLLRSTEGLAGAPEWPSVRALLPELEGSRVVDLGCGYGWFCRWAREAGAQRVLGLDVSEAMLERARRTTADAGIEYVRADLENVALPAASFDLAYSSLAFHYIEDLGQLLATVHSSLVPGGRLVFSAEHPVYSAPSRQEWLVDADGRRIWPVEGYLVEGKRSTNFLTKGVVKQHRTIGTYLNLLIRLGFSIDHVEEWGPSDAQIAASPDLAEHRDRPMFWLCAAAKR